MKYSLGISSFLEEISSLSHSIRFPLFLCIDPWGRLSYLSLLFLGTLHSNGYIFLFLLCLLHLFFSQLPASGNHFAFLRFFFLGMILITAFCTMSWTSVYSSSGTLDLIPRIYLSLPLFNHKGFVFDLVIFPYFLQFKSEFGNKEFMIWATVSSWSCFCWPYRASPSLAYDHLK